MKGKYNRQLDRQDQSKDDRPGIEGHQGREPLVPM